MATGGGRYWQVVLGVAVALIVIPSTTPQGEWVGPYGCVGRTLLINQIVM